MAEDIVVKALKKEVTFLRGKIDEIKELTNQLEVVWNEKTNDGIVVYQKLKEILKGV